MHKQIFTNPQYLKQIILLSCLPALVGMWFVQMIPTWEIVQPIAILIFFILTIVFAFRWRSQTAPSQRIKLFRPFIFFPFLAIFVLVSPLLYFLLTFRFDYGYVATYQFQGLPTTLYIYETSCFLDGRCLKYSATDIKIRVGILPIMTNLISCPCLFNKPYLQGDIATFTIEKSRDKSKVAVSIDMRNGKLL
ncbi:hypothetical protein [Pseudanabaena sp. BC1403]|uniref:hypothetical protein n=1 Tax=Pseudanabaena sp. BC1403 TaxID=2043171 RepID=UPI000CD99A51|nr:hypothetical protein [Pseudanabaena sp. BC1403]